MELDQGSAVDRYIVQGLIGQGGVASVYRVRHSGLGTEHALKVVHVPSPMVTERLLQEGRVQGRLRHPNVVSVTDLVTVRGSPGLVMEYVPGPSLDRFLADGPLTLEQADAVVRGILAGVAAAHRVGLVHRDLKPGNVLVDVADGQIVPKIVDFGLAKVLAAEPDSPIQTRAGASLGTPAYMAPEQIEDASQVDERADVFALGTILYELVHGHRAFAGKSVAEVYTAIRSGDHQAMSQDLPGRMDQAIRGALARDPGERTASVEALLAQWSGDVPPPRPVWTAQQLARAQLTGGPDPAAGGTPWSSTFAGEDKTTHETWTEPGHELAETRAVAALPPADARAAWWLGGIVAVSALVAVGAWWLQPQPVQHLGPDGSAPVVSADSGTQRQFESAWTDYLEADFAQSERRLRAVRTSEPNQLLPHVLASSSLMFLGDVPASLEAMSDARGLASEGVAGPGRGLVDVLQGIQQRSGANIPRELLAYIKDNPEDYLARVMAALHCSTTSVVADCDEAHRQLLAADADPVVAHVAIARSWMDLGELGRARDAAAVGLGIDPQEPGLLALVGDSWLAAGDFGQARASYEAALVADPSRRGPKVALAKVALLADDGTWGRITEELLAPTVPAADRVELHVEAFETLLGLGRVGEALAHLDRAVAIERDEGTPLGVLTAVSHSTAAHMLQGRTDLVIKAVQLELEIVGSSPEIPNPVRNRYATYPAWAQGMHAANTGDRQGLENAIRRIAAAELTQLGSIEGLKRELAVMDRDEQGIRAASTMFWTECDRQATLGGAFQRAGLMAQAVAAWEQVLSSPCRLHRPERASRVAALVGLGEVARDAGRQPEADSFLAQAVALWPQADADLPLMQRMERLRR